MKFDIAFIDMACSKPYTYDTLENDSIGGTEGSTIRLAEGFASKGHKVCIVQRHDILPFTSPAGVRYLPMRWLSAVRPTNVIHLRGRQHFDKFKGSKQFAWLHDACSIEHNNISDWHTYTMPFNVKCISVSDWHTENIKSVNPNLDIQRIYSPVDEICYNFPRSQENIDKYQLVWMSSPHKGLIPTIEVFNKLLQMDTRFKLIVFNPGYFKQHLESSNNIRFLTETKREAMRQVIAQSLCLFYPTQFEETFGLVAAEANALGTPVATYKIAALGESCGNEFAKSEEDLIDKVWQWRSGQRPIVNGQARFRFENIYPQWLELFNRN